MTRPNPENLAREQVYRKQTCHEKSETGPIVDTSHGPCYNPSLWKEVSLDGKKTFISG